MQTKTKTTQKSVTTILYTFEDLRKALNLPEDAQIIVTPPEDYEEGILIINEDTRVEAEYIVTQTYTNKDGENTALGSGRIR